MVRVRSRYAVVSMMILAFLAAFFAVVAWMSVFDDDLYIWAFPFGILAFLLITLRARRISILFEEDEITVVNLLRTHIVRWDQIEGVCDAWLPLSADPVLALVTRTGSVAMTGSAKLLPKDRSLVEELVIEQLTRRGITSGSPVVYSDDRSIRHFSARPIAVGLAVAVVGITTVVILRWDSGWFLAVVVASVPLGYLGAWWLRRLL